MEYNLGSIITNPGARKVLYGLYALSGLFFGASAAWYLAIQVPTPEWVTGGLGVLGYLAIPFGALALANVGNTAGNGTDGTPQAPEVLEVEESA